MDQRKQEYRLKSFLKVQSQDALFMLLGEIDQMVDVLTDDQLNEIYKMLEYLVDLENYLNNYLKRIIWGVQDQQQKDAI